MSWYPLIRDLGSQLAQWSGWTAPVRALRGKLSIATFHRVLEPAERAEYPLAQKLAITPQDLSLLLEALAERFTCTTLAEAHRRWATGEQPERALLALTFDDGQLDNATRAAPVLKQHGLRASFFIVARAAESGECLWHDRVAFALSRALTRDEKETRALLAELSSESNETFEVVERVKRRFDGMAERERWAERLERAAGGAWRPAWDGMLSWNDVRALHAAGHEIGSHSLSHPLLPQCADGELARELAGSKEVIERALGAPVTSFCYPNGDWDPRVADAVKAAGYERAVTTEHGWNARGAPAFSLRRCDLTDCADRKGHFSEARLDWRLARS